MKKIVAVLACGLMAFSAKAQLANTKWQGNINAQMKMPVVMSFTKDTVSIVNEGTSLSEVMSYKIKGDTLVAKKIEGMSPCEPDSEFLLKFTISNNELMLSPITDDCDMRKKAWMSDPFIKM